MTSIFPLLQFLLGLTLIGYLLSGLALAFPMRRDAKAYFEEVGKQSRLAGFARRNRVLRVMQWLEDGTSFDYFITKFPLVALFWPAFWFFLSKEFEQGVRMSCLYNDRETLRIAKILSASGLPVVDPDGDSDSFGPGFVVRRLPTVFSRFVIFYQGGSPRGMNGVSVVVISAIAEYLFYQSLIDGAGGRGRAHGESVDEFSPEEVWGEDISSIDNLDISPAAQSLISSYLRSPDSNESTLHARALATILDSNLSFLDSPAFVDSRRVYPCIIVESTSVAPFVKSIADALSDGDSD